MGRDKDDRAALGSEPDGWNWDTLDEVLSHVCVKNWTEWWDFELLLKIINDLINCFMRMHQYYINSFSDWNVMKMWTGRSGKEE